MAAEEHQAPRAFGGITEGRSSDRRTYLLVLPIVLALMALVGWALVQGSRASAAERSLVAANQQNDEFRKELENRDRLVADAMKDDSLLRSPGQATSSFVTAGPGSTESGLAIADPQRKVAKVYLYGLVTPPEGQEYAVAARSADGTKALGSLVVNPQGNAFLLAKDVPEGTTSIDVLFRPSGAQDLANASPRVTARYPAGPDDRGILPAKPVPQARRARR